MYLNTSWLLWINVFQVHQWDKEPAVSTQSQWAQRDAVWGPDESPRRPHRSGVWETNYCCCRCAEGCALRRGVSKQWHLFTLSHRHVPLHRIQPDSCVAQATVVKHLWSATRQLKHSRSQHNIDGQCKKKNMTTTVNRILLYRYKVTVKK